MKVYYIGGSPCSGKSTVAEMISRKHDIYYYKLDDRLHDHMKQAAKDGKYLCKSYFNMTPDQVWMRKPYIQFDDEVNIYKEIFEYALREIRKLNIPTVITEGSGFLPELMKQIGVGKSEYICITPTRDFQEKEYSKREWVPDILKGCKDKKAAFRNWMERDGLFAIYVSENARKSGYKTMLTDGMTNSLNTLNIVEKIFGL